MNGRLALILLLAGVWCYLAWNAWQRGSTNAAIAYLAIGAAFTVLRLRRTRA